VSRYAEKTSRGDGVSDVPDLNPEQQLVVAHGSGPLRVGAVAGAGKTTALVERVVHLVRKKHVQPKRILMISFSKSAAQQMKRRIEKRLPGYDAGQCAKTFHSIGLRIFKAEGDPHDEKTIDTSGLLYLKAITKAYKALHLEPEKRIAKAFAGQVKNNLLGTTETLRRLGRLDGRMVRIAEDLAQGEALDAAMIIEAYFATEKIREHTGVEYNGMPVTFVTFDDMIYQDAMLLAKKDIRERWGERWSHVLQDECVVGDTPVLMADGTQRAIRDLVAEKCGGDVTTWSPSTGTVARPIISWAQKPVTKPMVRIVTKRASRNKDGSLTPYRSNSWTRANNICTRYLVCTDDHPVWTVNRGWVPAGELRPGDHVQHETGAEANLAYLNKYKIGVRGREILGALISQRNADGTCGTNQRGSSGPPTRGGNGHVAPAEEALLAKLNSCWQHNITVPLGWSGYPRSYKLDIADPERRVGIELDGNSHNSPSRREADLRKELLLRDRGWLLLRYSNAESYTLTDQMIEQDICRALGEGCPSDAVVLKAEPWIPNEPWVYDIGVSGTHAFYADGMLIHNCQDENEAQAAIAEALVHKHRNYMVVGDPAQAIFGFRGSRPEKMLGFEEQWPGAKTVIMHRNYRSGIEIVDLANRIMGHMPASTVITDDMGVAADMTSERQVHSYVGYHTFESPEDEADAVANNIVAHNKQGVRWDEQAVLMRMNFMTRAIEMSLATRGVPYKLVSGQSFFTMKETKILLGYLRAIGSRATADTIGDALMYPSRSIGRAFVKQVVEHGAKNGDWVPAVKATAQRTSAYQARNAVGWARLVEVWRTRGLGPADLLNLVRKDVKLDEWLSRNVDEGEDSKAVDNLNEVVAFARNYETVDAMIDAIDAIDRHRAANARKRNAVTISTVHKAKGMEWQVVYLIHVASGFFPGSRSDLNEERRLFYVACTRPKDELWVSMPCEIRGEEAGESRFTIAEAGLVEEKEYRVGIAMPGQVAVGTQMELV